MIRANAGDCAHYHVVVVSRLNMKMMMMVLMVMMLVLFICKWLPRRGGLFDVSLDVSHFDC